MGYVKLNLYVTLYIYVGQISLNIVVNPILFPDSLSTCCLFSNIYEMLRPYDTIIFNYDLH